MARPALSASRTIDVLDLLAAFPGRAFTMSEIVRAAKINVASCHAVLNALSDRGYLAKVGKRYTLGRALIAVGQAALVSHRLVALAQDAAAALHAETGAPVLLSTIAGDEIVALSSIADEAGHVAGMRAGQRASLIPPAGAHFLAWAPASEIEAWLAKAEDETPATIAEWRESLALIRRRGFQVTLRVQIPAAFATLLEEMATGRAPLEYKDRTDSLMHDQTWRLSQPATIDPDERYDVVLLAAPIFDGDGRAVMSLCLGGFPEPLTGTQIETYAARLIEACLRVMRKDRVG